MRSSGLRQQVLSNLIDETLQIQAAKAEEIEITDADIDKTVERVAGNVKQTPDQMADYLKSRGSSIRSIRRQIQGEIAWRRLQSKKIESTVSVGDEEVQAVIDKLNASKGAEEFRVGEIFISANSANEAAGRTPTPSKRVRRAAAGRLVRRLCPPILRSVDRRGRRRPRLGAARTAARCSSRSASGRCARA